MNNSGERRGDDKTELDGVSEPKRKKTRKEKKTSSLPTARDENKDNYLLNLDILSFGIVLNDANLTGSLALGRTCKRGKERVKQYFRMCGPEVRVREDVKLFRELEDEIDSVGGKPVAVSFDVLHEYFANACKGGHMLTLKTILSEHAQREGVHWKSWIDYALLRKVISKAYEAGHHEIVPVVVEWFGMSLQQFFIPETYENGDQSNSNNECLSSAIESGNLDAVKWCFKKFSIGLDYTDGYDLLECACVSGNLDVARYIVSKFEYDAIIVSNMHHMSLLWCRNLPMIQWYLDEFNVDKNDIRYNYFEHIKDAAEKGLGIFTYFLVRYEITEKELREVDTKTIPDIICHALISKCCDVLRWIKEHWTIQLSDLELSFNLFEYNFLIACSCGFFESISFIFEGFGWSPRQNWGKYRMMYLRAVLKAINDKHLDLTKYLIRKADLFQGTDEESENDRLEIQEVVQSIAKHRYENGYHELVEFLVEECGFKVELPLTKNTLSILRRTRNND